jgi:transforming growth factor-beta-induced protein
VTSSQGTRTTLTETDINFAGGIIQVTENLVIPPSRLEKVADSFKLASFLGALYSAELMPAAAEQANVTIFAPRNEALKLVGGSLSALDKAAFSKVVGYHVVPGQILSSSLLQNGSILTTQSSQQIHVRKAGNNVYINSAQVMQSDILLANGVLHIIEHVLNPEAPDILPNPEVATQAPAFAVSTVTGLPFTTALPCTTNCPVTTTSSPPRTTTSSLSRSSTGGAAGPARCTGILGGTALGVLGMGVGLAMAV